MLERREDGQGPRALCSSSSNNIIPSQLNNANSILLVRFPGLGRGINLETPGHRGGFGPFSGC